MQQPGPAGGTPAVHRCDFIVMEYVAGKTLHELIGRKGLKVAETLKYAIQVADALAAAHAAGIVHRDLKPANIMVTEKGLVKVLDFGLAKLAEADSGYEGETLTARADAPRTEQGTILGTVAYMSPEQAEGKKVDARSDIFSFGSVLYQMITGRRAFRGETRLSTQWAILREEPQPISSIVEDTPRELERIVTRCLRKDPARRFQPAVAPPGGNGGACPAAGGTWPAAGAAPAGRGGGRRQGAMLSRLASANWCTRSATRSRHAPRPGASLDCAAVQAVQQRVAAAT